MTDIAEAALGLYQILLLTLLCIGIFLPKESYASGNVTLRSILGVPCLEWIIAFDATAGQLSAQ